MFHIVSHRLLFMTWSSEEITIHKAIVYEPATRRFKLRVNYMGLSSQLAHITRPRQHVHKPLIGK